MKKKYFLIIGVLVTVVVASFIFHRSKKPIKQVSIDKVIIQDKKEDLPRFDSNFAEKNRFILEDSNKDDSKKAVTAKTKEIISVENMSKQQLDEYDQKYLPEEEQDLGIYISPKKIKELKKKGIQIY